jgi:peptidoglycan/LPS O-acetylase OafA/YrhL
VIISLSYLAALLLTCAYLARFGGRTGRWGGAIVLGGFLLSLAAVYASAWISAFSYTLVSNSLVIIDLFSLIAKVMLALYSNRRWPLWVAAFQFNTVAAHGVAMISPAIKGEYYYAMITVWAVPTLFVMVVGTMLDRRKEALLRDRFGISHGY